MIRYEEATITPVSGAETYAAEALVMGQVGKRKKVTGVYALDTNTIHTRVYKDSDRIASIDNNAFGDGNGFQMLDFELAPGEACKVALYSTSGTTAQYVVIKYEEN